MTRELPEGCRVKDYGTDLNKFSMTLFEESWSH